MKAIIVLACLIGIAWGEPCDGTDTTQCANEICLTGYVPTCESKICTCSPTPDPTGCVTLADCSQYWSMHHCSLHQRHCDNGHCKCIHGHGHGR